MKHEAHPPVHPWVRTLHRFQTYLGQDFLGGPRWLKLAWLINFHKGSMLIVIGVLMWLYDNTSTVAWVYLALHGSYGLCWLIKDASFPDPQWEKRITTGGALVSVVMVLGPYWLFPYLLISRTLVSQPPPDFILALAIGIHTIGIVVMMSADAQKYYTLKYRPGLIQEGLFARVRHPNYLGEMLTYAAYALLLQHWIAWAILGFIWLGYFLINMLMKEASLARYPQWSDYKAHTGMLWPRIRRNDPVLPPNRPPDSAHQPD